MGTPMTGREILIGLKKAATWRTAVACGANDGLLILSESMSMEREKLIDDSLGSIWPKYMDHGGKNVKGGVEGYMKYEGLDVALALIMGVAGAPATPSGGTSARTNSYKLADSLDGLFATMAIKKKSDIIFEYPTTKLHGFKLSGVMNEVLKISLDCISNKEVLDSSVNTAATMANLTYPDTQNRIILDSQGWVKITDKSGGVFENSDQIYPSGYELTFSRPNEGDFVIGYDGIDEPAGTAFPEITLTLNFPRYNDANHAFFSDWDANTEKKLEIHHRGAVIDSSVTAATWAVATAYVLGDIVQPVSPGSFFYKCIVAGTSHATTEPTWPTTLGETMVDEGVTWQTVENKYYYYFDMLMPHLRVINPKAPVSGPGKIPSTISFQLLGCDTAPTGMAGITTPIQINVLNTRTTDPLA